MSQKTARRNRQELRAQGIDTTPAPKKPTGVYQSRGDRSRAFKAAFKAWEAELLAEQAQKKKDAAAKRKAAREAKKEPTA